MVDLASVARAVIVGSLGVHRGERVWVHGWDHAVDLMSQLAMECGRAGAEVLLTVEPEELWLHSLLSSPLESLEKLSRYQSSLLAGTEKTGSLTEDSTRQEKGREHLARHALRQ